MPYEVNAFWRYSLQVYRCSGTEAACLALQESCGADVNLLLLCCWLGRGGRALDRRELRGAMAVAASWQQDVVRPLRMARRGLKTATPRTEQAVELRQRILALELEAERVEQDLLFAWALALPARARRLAPEAATGASLKRYGALLGVDGVAVRDGDLALHALARAVTAVSVDSAQDP